jgi:hypothetical protein
MKAAAGVSFKAQFCSSPQESPRKFPSLITLRRRKTVYFWTGSMVDSPPFRPVFLSKSALSNSQQKISLEKSMKKNAERMPRARQQGLIIEDLPGEVLVYDSERDRAHCLNQTAALVWKYCDGKTTVSQMARNLERDLNTANVDERMVSYALEQLSRDHLLEESFVPATMLSGLTRRQMVRTLGIAAVIAVPVVTSIVVPTARAATTCTSPGQPCGSSAQCCSGLCSGGTCA